jgi:hypothetical protein
MRDLIRIVMIVTWAHHQHPLPLAFGSPPLQSCLPLIRFHPLLRFEMVIAIAASTPSPPPPLPPSQ